MTHSDGDSLAFAASSASALAETYEIVSPVADAMAVLADAMQGSAGSLSGASIAKSVSGTLLLNAHAWNLFGETLRRDLPDLVVVQARPASKPLRFLLTTSPVRLFDA